jgi:hypothetical protein
VRTKAKRISLVACLFLFLFVVIGNALHLNPAGAFLAAATGTPLLIYVFKQRSSTTNTKGKFSRNAARSDGRNQEHGDSSAVWEDQPVSRQ